jgi:hypothetical protein
LRTEEFESKATPGKKTGVLAIVEGVRFWAREDAVNEDRNLIDPAVSLCYGRTGRALPTRGGPVEFGNEAFANTSTRFSAQ